VFYPFKDCYEVSKNDVNKFRISYAAVSEKLSNILQFRLFAVAFSIMFDFLSDYHDDLSNYLIKSFAQQLKMPVS